MRFFDVMEEGLLGDRTPTVSYHLVPSDLYPGVMAATFLFISCTYDLLWLIN